MGNRPALIESLEDRRLFAITFAHHVLNVVGSGGAPNKIVVGLSADGQSIDAHLSYPFKKTSRSFDVAIPFSKGINQIKITGGSGSDAITIDQTNGGYAITTVITTKNGNDTVMGGNEADRIVCGNGIDAVISGGGDDTILAGKGPDTLVGGSGNDHFFLGKGHNLVVAGDAANVFTDPYGHNTITAGSGHDTYVMKNRNINLDDTTYSTSKDTLKNYEPADSSNNGWVNDVVGAVLGYLW